MDCLLVNGSFHSTLHGNFSGIISITRHQKELKVGKITKEKS